MAPVAPPLSSKNTTHTTTLRVTNDTEAWQRPSLAGELTCQTQISLLDCIFALLRNILGKPKGPVLVLRQYYENKPLGGRFGRL